MVEDLTELIAAACERACLLEAGAEKPGNVTPTKRFEDTTFKDFEAGAKALRPVFGEAAERGARAAAGEITLQQVGLGALILDGVRAVKQSHSGGNTHLGITLLLTPLCVAAGIDLKNFREAVRGVISSSTVEDSLNLYDAINLAEPGGLGDSELDVRDEKSKEVLRRDGVTFKQLMDLSAERDVVTRELARGYPVTFNEGAPLFKKLVDEGIEEKRALEQTYLILLSRHHDTLIERKRGKQVAEKVLSKAGEVVDVGGILTPPGRRLSAALDDFLRSDGNKLNPGATADLACASALTVFLEE